MRTTESGGAQAHTRPFGQGGAAVVVEVLVTDVVVLVAVVGDFEDQLLTPIAVDHIELVGRVETTGVIFRKPVALNAVWVGA